MGNGDYSPYQYSKVFIWKCPTKLGKNLKKGSSQTELARVKLKGLVSLKSGCLILFRYPTHDFTSDLGRGVRVKKVHWGWEAPIWWFSGQKMWLKEYFFITTENYTAHVGKILSRIKRSIEGGGWNQSDDIQASRLKTPPHVTEIEKAKESFKAPYISKQTLNQLKNRK